MPRPYHSPSSLALGARCEAAWAWTYVAGIREPEISWEAIEAGAKWSRSQRACALGKAMHKVGEDWYRGLTPKWESLPGRIFASGVHLLPQPSRCRVIEVECAVGEEPSGIVEEGRPPTVLVVEGTRFAGFRDLAVLSAEETERFGWLCHGWALFDYKSSANIARYAKTRDDLIADPQCNLYALDLMIRHDLRELPARWVYFETKDVRRAAPVDVLIERQRAVDLLAALGPLAARLDSIEDPALAACNTDACGDYGGCPHHVSAGGPCLARRSLGTLIQLNSRREKSMPIDANVRAKFNAEVMKRTSEPPPAAPEVIEAAGTEVAPELPVVEVKKPRAPRKPKDEAPSAVTVVAPVSLSASPAGEVLRRMTALAEAQANLDVLTTEQEAATLRMHDAQSVVDNILAEIKEAI